MDIGMKSTADAFVVKVPDTEEDSMDIYDGLDNDLSSNKETSPDAFRLKESMDLYEEIVTEEQQNRESTYLELMSRFQAAQTQIKELHQRLEQMELQNTGLNTENYRLKKNISALLQTARQEVTRKDAEIQRLNRRPDRGGSHHMNYLGDKSQSQRFSLEISKNRQLLSTTSPLTLPQPPNNLRPALLPPPTSPLRKNHPAQETSQSSQKERINPATPLSGPSTASLYSHSKSSSKGKSTTHHSDFSKEKATHSEKKHHPQSESSDREHRSSDPSTDCSGLEKKGCKSEQSSGRSNPGSCKNRSYSNDEGHHRSHRMKSPPLHNSKGITSSTEKKRSHERRQDTPKFSRTDSKHHADHSCKKSKSRADIKCKCREQRIQSSDIKEQKKISPKKHCVWQSDCSKERTGDRPSKSDPRKEDGLHADKPDRKSQQSKTCAKRNSKDRDSSRKESKNPVQDVLKRICDASSVAEKKSVKESSPHRKLCFMETLNLTRSPIKKPALSTDKNHTSVDMIIEKEPSSKDSSELDIENMHIIDEVSGSELEAGSEDVVEQPQKSKDPQSKSCEDDTCAQAKDQNSGKSIVSDQQLEEHLVQTVSAYVQPIRTEEDLKSVCLTHTSPDSSSFQAGSLGSDEGHTKMASNSHIDKLETAQPTAGVTDCSSSLKNNSDNVFESSVIANEPYVTGSSPKQAPSSGITALKNGEKRTPASQLQEHSAINDGSDAASLQNQEPHPPATCSNQEKDSDVVSSTINLELLPQEGLSLPDAIYILTQADEPASDVDSTSNKAGCLTGCDAVSKISSTTQEVFLPDTDGEPSVTPKKGFRPGKSHENNLEPPSSKSFLHDEDSMMHILSNLKMIPDAISPLRSPIQTSKRSHVCAQSKPGLMKNLDKELSNIAVEGTTKKLDVNKENKYPGSPAKHEAQSSVDNGSNLPSNLSDTELEEGEILSESDAADSPVPAAKRPKLACPVKIKASPKTVWNKTSKERCATSKEANLTIGFMSHSPKSRFKTVCPAATKSSFSTVEEVMETFRLVRTEIRKKYMKLHKTFPRKSFYGVMDNFQESFLEFVEGAYFGRICLQQNPLKSKLKKVITSVFRKVSNNGIVKRIFEQQAVDLKQKLWDFVDVQVDYLFQKLDSTLKVFCKRAATEAEEKRPTKRENAPKQAPTSGSKYQLKEPPPPKDPKQLKPCAVVPYKTGQGSRGKDIRIIHVDKERKAELYPKGGSNTQSAASLQMPTMIPVTPEKSNSFVIPPNGSLLDKTDFELLTEQQTSSLTFNLVRDTQMGEIFKCLLQGTDMLETSSITSDSTPWHLGTPRKDGEHFISISTPSKFDSPAKFSSKLDTPSKLIEAWSIISPHKMPSPRSKAQLPLNPALFDESCLLEVPLENRAQSSYSLLADDLAVSLTIPSPLKSDSHLSFLHPPNMHAMSTPDSVISAHISEDALLDEEDASEQDIHLALDTDNSSCSSDDSNVSGILTPFVFKPDQPMQALVMEKSNDHFIVKIRQGAVCAEAVPADGSSGHATQEFGQPHPEITTSQILPDKSSAVSPEKKHLQSVPDVSVTEVCSLTSELQNEEEQRTSVTCLLVSGQTTSESKKGLPATHGSDRELASGVQMSDQFCNEISRLRHRESTVDHAGCRANRIYEEVLQRSPDTVQGPHQPADPNKSEASDPDRFKKGALHSERDDVRSSPRQRDCLKGEKRKVKQEKSVLKRRRKQQQEEEEGQDNDESKSSPNSLYAKNVIKKKGAVVMSWTRDEDRAILMELKAKGASRSTFTALSGKLKKPSGQIAQRFYQLMKLYQQQGKADT